MLIMCVTRHLLLPFIEAKAKITLFKGFLRNGYITVRMAKPRPALMANSFLHEI